MADTGPLSEGGSAVTVGAEDASVGKLEEVGRVSPERRLVGIGPGLAIVVRVGCPKVAARGGVVVWLGSGAYHHDDASGREL